MAQKASPSFQAVDMLVTLTPGYLVGKYKNLVGKYENILWENIKTWSANIKTYCGQSFQILNMLLLEFDLVIINEDGFLEKRISSFHLEEDNVD